MSVDRTIEELSSTLAQLGMLVEHINTQIVGITARINVTLENFDNSVAGIAQDAGMMTGQVGDTIAQIPHAWVFYLLFITLIVVMVLLSVLIVINLITRVHSIYRILRGDTVRHSTTPLPSLVYSESKQPLNTGVGGAHGFQGAYQQGSPQSRMRHIAVPMESEPRRYGASGGGGGGMGYAPSAGTGRSAQGG